MREEYKHPFTLVHLAWVIGEQKLLVFFLTATVFAADDTHFFVRMIFLYVGARQVAKSYRGHLEHKYFAPAHKLRGVKYQSNGLLL